MSQRHLSARRRVGAPPERVYDAVSDLRRMAARSDEYIGSWRLWRGKPLAGARFVGWNRNGWHVWCTTCRVVTAERPRKFVFESGALGVPIARWSYRITATADGGSEVVESWDDLREAGTAGAVARALGVVFAGTPVQERVRRNAAGMRLTLARLAAEFDASGRTARSS